MQAIYRLKKNYQYGYVYKHSQSVSDKLFILLYCKSNSKQSKAGFSVSKKYGNAVSRNRIRRQMKSAAALLMPEAAPNFNLVLIPRRQKEYLFSEICSSFTYLFAKAGIITK